MSISEIYNQINDIQRYAITGAAARRLAGAKAKLNIKSFDSCWASLLSGRPMALIGGTGNDYLFGDNNIMTGGAVLFGRSQCEAANDVEWRVAA